MCEFLRWCMDAIILYYQIEIEGRLMIWRLWRGRADGGMYVWAL